MASDLHFLVVDGYNKEGRAGLTAGGATTAGVLYRQMLQRHSPGCTVDILYPSDPGVSIPVGTEVESYDGLAWTGSSLTVWRDADPDVLPQLELAKEAFRRQVPSFGSCWAAQIGVVAAGGAVLRTPLVGKWVLLVKLN